MTRQRLGTPSFFVIFIPVSAKLELGKTLETFQSQRKITPAKAEPEVVSRVAEHPSRKEEDSLALHQLRGEVLYRKGRYQLRKCDASRARPSPLEYATPLSEEAVQVHEIAGHDGSAASEQRVARA